MELNRQHRTFFLVVVVYICLPFIAFACGDDTQQLPQQPVHVPIFRSDHHIISLSNLSSLSFNTLDGQKVRLPKRPGGATPTATTKVPTRSSGGSAQPDGSFGIDRLSRALEAKLKSLRNTELGVPAIQHMFDGMSPAEVANGKHYAAAANHTELVAGFAQRLEDKLQQAFFAISDAIAVIALSTFKKLPTVVQPCPFADWATALDQHYDKTQIEIKNYRVPDRLANRTDDEKAASSMVMHALKPFRAGHFAFRRAYFLSSSDFGGEHLCHGIGAAEYIHLRAVLAASINQKNIMLIIDHGGSTLNAEQLDLTKAFATHLIALLNERDRLAIVAVAGHSTTHYATGGETAPRLYSANRDNHEHFARFIERLNGTKDITNHSLAFADAFRLLHQIYQHQEASDAVPMQMVYISRGLVSPLTEAKSVLEAIAGGQRLLRQPVVINTCAIVMDEKRVMYEKQFLKDVARQNYTKYGVDVSDWIELTPLNRNITGKMFVINQRDSAKEMVTTATAVFLRLLLDPQQLNDRVAGKLPEYVASGSSPNHHGSDEGDVVVAVYQTVSTLGLVGVDMYMSDLLEDVLVYEHDADSYAFVVDANGVAVMHPSYPRPSSMRQTIFYTDIRYLEGGRARGFAHVRQRLLVEPFGTATISSGALQMLTYSWHRATDLYVVCVVTARSSAPASTQPLGYYGVPADFHGADKTHEEMNIFLDDDLTPDLVFHRVDLVPIRGTLCRHFKQVATMDSITLFLGASAFARPFVYLQNYRDTHGEQRAHMAKSVMAYLKDTTDLLANPGLLPTVRHDVTALFHAMTYLKKRHMAGDPHDKYIIRRYVSTLNGVLQMFPGCVLSYDLDAMRRPWFVKAMQHPGQLVMTEPYLDAGGAGYIVTLAHTLHDATESTLRPFAVVAIDVTIGFLYKLLLAADPNCGATPHVKCFLMEDAGFVLAHPSILDPLTGAKTSRRPLEHVTHIESYMANDILHHRRLVEKRMCVNYSNRSRQRYYRFNTSLTEVLSNRVHGERTKYQLAVVPGTNVFVAWLNATGDGGAFCPCSTLDRICLNCNRMEPKICECPCECPLFVNEDDYEDGAADEMDLKDSPTADTEDGSSFEMARILREVCPSQSDAVAALDSWAVDVDLELQSCVDINCEVYGTQNDCLGVMGCEWCQVDMDSEPFSSPFCTQQSSCYNGVLGSPTPYGGEGDLGVQLVDSIVPPSYSAIGPVTGAIVALCLVVGFAMYCYRQTVDATANDRMYGGNSGQENAPFGMPLARFDYDDINPHDDGDLGGLNTMNRHLLQPQLAVPAADISPYRINAGAYRPAAGHHTESDHGYSTMTPREDSEHQCFALAEPLLRTKRVSSMSDSASISTSVSSPTNHNCFASSVVSDSPKSNVMSPKSGGGRRTPNRSPEATTNIDALPVSPHHIQAVVTVHHPMEMV